MARLLNKLCLLMMLSGAGAFEVLGLDLHSDFFSDGYVSRQVFVGNITEDETYIEDEVDPLLHYNSSTRNILIPLDFPLDTPAQTIELVLSVDLFPELLQLCIWRDRKGVFLTDVDAARIEVCKTCADFFDECLQQMHMRYNKRPPHLADGYNFRMVARVDEVKGRWNVRITHRVLPHHASVALHLSVTAKEYSVSAVAWGGLFTFLAATIALALSVAALFTVCRRPVLVTANAINNIAQLPPEQRGVRPALAAVARRVRDWAPWRRPERYAPMETPAASAATSGQTAAPPTSPPASAPPPPAEATSSAAAPPAPPLMEALWNRGMVQRPTAPPPAGEEEEENFCRICRCAEPEADLFSPCNCDGSMRLVHRACLAEWREKTTNPVNRLYCSECKTPFRIVVQDATFRFVLDSLCNLLRVLLPLLLLEVVLLAAGYTFKGVAGVFQGAPSLVDWTPDMFHHMLGLLLLVMFVIHRHVLGRCLEESLGSCLVSVLAGLSLFLEVITGYAAHLFFWWLGSTLWDWQVYYISGCLVVALYAFYLHDTVQAAYHRWAVQHRSEVVLDRNQLP